MFTIQAPTSVYSFSLRATLDGVDYDISMDFNARGGWFFSMEALDGTVIVPSRRAAVDWPLNTGATSELRPPGILALIDFSGKHVDAGSDSIGVSHYLIYIEAADLA